jgi:hypothetical protein
MFYRKFAERGTAAPFLLYKTKKVATKQQMVGRQADRQAGRQTGKQANAKGQSWVYTCEFGMLLLVSWQVICLDSGEALLWGE